MATGDVNATRRRRTRPPGPGLRVLAAVAVLLVGFASAQADELNVEASLDRNRVQVGEVVTLTVVLSSDGSAPTPELSAPDGFDVVGRNSSTSTSISIVNGSMTTTRRVSYIYSLRANQAGRFTIGPATVVSNGKTYRSQPLQVEVTATSAGPKPKTQAPAGSGARQQDLQEIGQNLFITAEPDRRTVYVGQQVTVTYRLHTRYDLQNVRYGQLPTYTGFWAETVFEAKRLNLSSEVVEGRAFRAATLKKVALFPTTTGDQALEQLEVVCDIPVRTRRRSLFDADPFDFDPFGRTSQVIVRSEDLSLEVLPLPGGAPNGFQGAVGRYTVSAQASPRTVRLGDPVTLKVTVAGQGNLNSVTEPAHPSTTAFRFYDPKITVNTDASSGRVSGSKTFEYVVIPGKEGRQAIPAFELTYFDPDAKVYRTAATRPVAISVSPGRAASAGPAVPTLSREEVKVLGEDIRYIKPDRAELTDQGGALYRERWFLMLQALPFVGFVLALAHQRRRERLLGDRAYARRRKSRSEASRRLSEARRLLDGPDTAAFCAELSRAITQFVADRLDLPAAGLTTESAAAQLASRGVSPDTVEQARALLAACDTGRFAPGQVPEERKAELLTEADGLIGRLTGVI